MVTPLDQPNAQLNRVNPPRLIELGEMGVESSGGLVSSSALNIVTNQVAQQCRRTGNEPREAPWVPVSQINSDGGLRIEVNERIPPTHMGELSPPVVPCRRRLVHRDGVGVSDGDLRGEFLGRRQRLAPQVAGLRSVVC